MKPVLILNDYLFYRISIRKMLYLFDKRYGIFFLSVHNQKYETCFSKKACKQISLLNLNQLF